MSLPIEQVRRDFWAHFAQSDPEVNARPYQDSNTWHPVTPDGSVILSFGIQQDGSSVFLRGRLYADQDTAGPVLRPHAAALARRLLVAFEGEGDLGQGRYLRKRTRDAFTLKRNWPEIARWFTACRLRYANVLADLIEVSA